MTDQVQPQAPITAAFLIEKYLVLRAKKDELKSKFKEDTEKITQLMDRIEGALGEKLKAEGGQNINTDKGTAYQTIKWSATVSDPEAFRAHLIKQLTAGGGWEGADIRANAPQIREQLARTNALPPGVNLTSMVEVNIRKASK